MVFSNLYNSYIKIETEWESISRTVIGPNSFLLSASPHVLDARIYRYQDRAIKIRKKNVDHNSQSSKLQNEYEVLLYLQQKEKHFDFYPDFKESNGFEFLSMNYISGTLFERYLEMKEVSIFQLFITALVLLRINLAGVSHRDITTSNIKIGKANQIIFLDFDQAVITSPLIAILNDFLGIALGIPKAIHPFRRLALRVLTSKIPVLAKVANLLRGARSKNNQPVLIVQLSKASQMTPNLLKLKDAWVNAAQSNANTPGVTSAYYSLCLEGFGFIGERSWESRWEAIKENVQFKDKKVLELGCNMGLFSTFIRLQGAKQCVGLDIDENIINSARLVGSAFDVDNLYEVADFDKESWSEGYLGFDIVIALSVLNWLKNKKDFLKFLAKHQELIYEGHDSFQIEYDRLKSCGFSFIQIISVSERGRTIFYASK